jgi:muramoyltetrapeptide carboxypeptidase
MIRPPVLERGDTLGVVSPAGPVRRERLEAGLASLRALGFHLVLARHVFDRDGYLAGRDEDRAGDMMEMFLSPGVKGIIAARGGYGCARMVDLLDYRAISQSPKAFVGSSDITFLHLALQQKAGLITFHGPMVEVDPETGFPSYSLEGLFTALTVTRPLGFLGMPPGTRTRALSPGTAEGPLAGGNLSLLVSSLGTPYELDTLGKILLLEEVGERPYRVDRMLRQMEMSGKLRDAAGIVVGDMTRCDPVEGEESQSIEEVLEHALARIGKPCLVGLPFGHGAYKATLPLGVIARLDAGAGMLEFTQAALEEGKL